MKEYETDQIRNVVILGHGGTGKTSLSESALFASGAITRLGSVDDGNTTSDHDPLFTLTTDHRPLSTVHCPLTTEH